MAETNNQKNQMCERSGAEWACEGEAGAPIKWMECSIVHLMKLQFYLNGLIELQWMECSIVHLMKLQFYLNGLIELQWMECSIVHLMNWGVLRFKYDF